MPKQKIYLRIAGTTLALACFVAACSGRKGTPDGATGIGAAGTSAAGTAAAGTGAAGSPAAGTSAAGNGSAGTGAAGAGAAGQIGADAGAGNSGTAGAPDAAVDRAPDTAPSSDGPTDRVATPDAGPSSKRQRSHALGSNGAPNGYHEYLPPGYDGQTPMPLLVFWHGIGEDGNGTTDLAKVLANGPPKLIAIDKWPATRPFIVLSPQYVPTSGAIGPGLGCPSGTTVDTFLKWALAHYKVDPKRVYLTGLSCGAIGTWDYLGTFKGAVVAAAVPISGNPGDPTQASSAWKRAMCGLGEVALWSIHGDADPVVPFAPDRDTVQNVSACPAPPRRNAKFTPIPGGGHDVWTATYDLSGGSGDIYAWLLANPKP